MPFRFEEREPVRWTGRYRRIPGRQSVLHVRWDDAVDLIWQDGCDSCTCLARMTDDLERLARSANRVKRQRTGQPGGSFVINEHGQVISPVADASFERFFVGNCTGAITFVGPDGGPFTLNDDAGIEPGDDWQLPYLGIVYNLSHENRVYFQSTEDHDTECQYPPSQDENLIRALRRIRGYGGLRFIVNPHGIVLTKAVEEASNWQPKYVGRIDYRYWFPREPS